MEFFKNFLLSLTLISFQLFFQQIKCQVSELCQFTQQNVCKITKSHYFNDNQNVTVHDMDIIISQNVVLICNVTIGQVCQLMFNTNANFIMQQAQLWATDIIITATQISISDSQISTNGSVAGGLGQYNNNSFQNNVGGGGVGNAFAGIGSFAQWNGAAATCMSIQDQMSLINQQILYDQSYGKMCIQYNDTKYMPLIDNQMYGTGSQLPYFQGGGRIILYSDSDLVFTNSSISSAGFPLKSDLLNKQLCSALLTLNGTINNPSQQNAQQQISAEQQQYSGTGGTIFIKSYATVSVDNLTYFNAEGGYYCPMPNDGMPLNNESYLGGSGGKITITSRLQQPFIDSNIILNGGLCASDQCNNQCLNGAMGVLCHTDNKQIVISQNSLILQLTKLTSTPTVLHPSDAVLSDASLFINNAAVQYKQQQASFNKIVKINEVILTNSSILSDLFQLGADPIINIDSLTVSQDSAVYIFSDSSLHNLTNNVSDFTLQGNSTLYVYFNFWVNSSIFLLESNSFCIAQQPTAFSQQSMIIYANQCIIIWSSSLININLLSIVSDNITVVDSIFISGVNRCTDSADDIALRFFNFLDQADYNSHYSDNQSNASLQQNSHLQNNQQQLSIQNSVKYWQKQNNLDSLDLSLALFMMFDDLLDNNFTLLLFSSTDIIFQNSTLQAAKIGVFAEELFIDENSTLNSSGMGCLSGTGLGKGSIIMHDNKSCGGSGGQYGGKAGYGLGNSYIETLFCLAVTQELEFKNSIMRYGNMLYPNYEGSGGGSADKAGGAGGGIVLIGVLNNIQLQGSLSSDGQQATRCDDPTGSGSGSGGSVLIFATRLNGSGYISAQGGAANVFCGEGGGGRIMLNFSQWWDASVYLDTISNNVNQNPFAGLLSVQSGTRDIDQHHNYIDNFSQFLGQNGTIVTTPCPPGFAPNPLCSPCPAMTYSDEYGNGGCMDCINKPFEAEYIPLIGLNSSNCIYKCTLSPGFNDNILDLQCQNSMLVYAQYLLSTYGIVQLILFVTALFAGGLTRHLYFKREMHNHTPLFLQQPINAVIKEDNVNNSVQHQSQIVSENEPSYQKQKEMTSGKHIINKHLIVQELKKTDEFQFEDIFYHIHRINVNGTNRFDNRWYLSAEPPEEVDHIISKEQYLLFVQIFNKECHYPRFKALLLRLIALVYYPLYLILMDHLRKKKFQKLQYFLNNYFSEQSQNFLIPNANEISALNPIKVKLSCSSDFTNCCLDFFNYSQRHNRYLTLERPFNLILSGEGNYSKPINVHLQDPFVEFLYLVINNLQMMQQGYQHNLQSIMKQLQMDQQAMHNNAQMYQFLKQFNYYACAIDFSSLPQTFFCSVQKLCDHVTEWNSMFFSPLNICVQLMVMQIPKERFFMEESIVSILEDHYSNEFKQFIYDAQKNKIFYSFYDVKFSLIIFSTSQQSQLQQKDNFNLNTVNHTLLDSELINANTLTPQQSVMRTGNFNAAAIAQQKEEYNLYSVLSKPFGYDEDVNDNNPISQIIDKYKEKINAQYVNTIQPFMRKEQDSNILLLKQQNALFEAEKKVKRKMTALKMQKSVRRFIVLLRSLLITHRNIKAVNKKLVSLIQGFFLLVEFSLFIFVTINLWVFGYYEDKVALWAPFPISTFLAQIFGLLSVLF